MLLQGPVGPFFARLSEDLVNIGAAVYKINFNGGDKYFSSLMSVDFTGTLEEWGSFFERFVNEKRIDTVMLFGDCRSYHAIAHAVASRYNLTIGVFEEGYVRPDYITFEEFGVNGRSLLTKEADFYRRLETYEYAVPRTHPVGNTFWNAVWWAILYYFFSTLYYYRFPYYRHHRPLNLLEGLYWIRSLYRKWLYRLKELGLEARASGEWSHRYFLVPLQIATDAQIKEYSSFNSVEDFIENVIASFAEHAPRGTFLLIKHHPLDRGYHDYKKLITKFSEQYGISEWVYYIHDQHLPTLLEHARGVVLVNSTVGMSALHHNVPLKCCGTAVYHFEGLTYQGTLDQFWKETEGFNTDRSLYERFRGYVIRNKQINGSFYRGLRFSKLRCGLLWPD